MAVIHRTANWQAALRTWARGAVGQPYVWGKTDCGSIGRDALVVMFGDRILKGIVWPTARAATRVLARHGTMSEILIRLGATKKPASFAQSGDIVIEHSPEAPGGESACVVVDGVMAVYSTHDGGVVWGPVPTTGDAYSLWQVTDG